VEAWVVAGALEASVANSVADVESGMTWAFEQLKSYSQRFPEFGSYKQGEQET